MESKQVEFIELRIGNILRIDGALSVVEEIKKNGLGYHLVPNETFLHQPSQGFKPIPLTEEWLVRFGFEIHVNMNNEYLKKDVLYFYGKGLLLSIGEYSSESFGHIKYIHQLQNLYYALTGEELTIK